MTKPAIILALCVAAVSADIYMNFPRGGNNRLDDNNRDRNNANRMFDSQNNNRGGTNVGSLMFYQGSKVPIQWKAQHSCGANPETGAQNTNCEVIIQAMCDPKVRDGTVTNTIPTNPQNCYNLDCDNDVRFGRHESLESYMYCTNRERNKGLFTSNQNLNGNTAQYTRQNPNGGRRGLECPEERDYYPYWNPSQWIDLAIFTNQESRCKAYKTESQNVKPREYCKVDIMALARSGAKNAAGDDIDIPLNKQDCELLEYDAAANSNSTLANKKANGVWATAPAHGVPAPECGGNVFSRDNHLGNVEGGELMTYTWEVPDWLESEQCVFRIRYNMTSGDMDHFDNATTLASTTLTAKQNKAAGNRNRNGIANVNIAQKYGIPENDDYNYVLQNNPQVKPFGADAELKLQLAINTAQYDRTFQDRSHVTAIRSRETLSEETKDTEIFVVSVAGKRGNIVQVYPDNEYEFVPNNLKLNEGASVHFTWTGSNTNPNNNAGQGRQGTDRSNIVLLSGRNYDEPIKPKAGLQRASAFGNSYPTGDVKNEKNNLMGLKGQDLVALALQSSDGGCLGGEISELDDCGPRFDLGVRKVTKQGVYQYMSTRNNNFSNRSQKGQIVVGDGETREVTVGISESEVKVGGGRVSTGEGVFEISQRLIVESIAVDSFGPVTNSRKAASELLHIAPVGGGQFQLQAGKSINIELSFKAPFLHGPVVWWSAQKEGTYSVHEGSTSVSGNVVSLGAQKAGFYVVESALDGLSVFIMILVILAVLACAAAGCWYKNRSASTYNHTNRMQNQI